MNSSLIQLIESLLFIESQSLTIAKLARVAQASREDVLHAVSELQKQYAQRSAGVVVVISSEHVQLVTCPESSEIVKQYVHDEQTGELTRPSLETLTIIAYRGPVAKSEIELIRGVNCSIILRNLLIRGLISEEGETETGSPLYAVTVDFLRFLGVSQTSELPNYQELNDNVALKELLDSQKSERGDFFSGDSQNTETSLETAPKTNPDTVV